MNASLAQVKLLRLLKRKLSITDEEYNAATNCDGEGTVELKTAQKLIIKWKHQAIAKGIWENRTPVLKYDNLPKHTRAKFATPEQLRKIDGLWREISHAKTEKERETALKVFLQRRFKILSIEAIQRDHAAKVIITLNAMIEQAKDKPQRTLDIGLSKKAGGKV